MTQQTTGQFKVDLIELPKLVRIDGEQRFYETPTGEKYPSVTTVLSAMTDKSALFKWKKRVGEEEAAKITARSARRGTNVHRLCENLVLNNPLDLKNEMPLNVHMYKQLERFLVKNVDDVRVSEGSLFSHKLKVAGSVDLVASYHTKPAIIDFKTAAKPKREEWIENYFLQASMYSYMLWEMTKLHHPKIVIAIAVEEETEAQVFVESASDWITKAHDMCKRFHLR